MPVKMNFVALWPRDWNDYEGEVVQKHLAPGFVALSFIVSFIGSWTTLELINRRTSTKGWYNWAILIGSSISMGGIAIWCMHFIGNRAIILGDGDSRIQITYGAGFTALSFFIPIMVLFLAFVAVGINDEISLVRLAVGGTLAGLGICGMHYLGQASITNYTCIYQVAKVIGSAIIAVVASITALGAFFLFRSAWNAVWWKRATCAIVLAGAVSGMHWLASVGTQYRLKMGVGPSNPTTRNATTISVIVLSITGCFILLLSTIIAQARKARAANRARQIVIASAIFDRDGKILVTAEGILPNEKITNSYHEQDDNDVFSISHPTFHWIFRATRNWRSVTELVAPMKTHLQRTGLRTRFGADSDAKFVSEQLDGNQIKDYHLVFQELFCTAAADLAADLHQPLEDIGVMFDEIIHTGQTPKPLPLIPGKPQSRPLDLERDGTAMENMGKGQLLFLVREADRQQTQQLQAAGYRFATPANVIPIIAATFQITRQELTRQVEVMRDYATENHILDPGVHLAFFAVKASMGAGFEVLVRNDARNQLPTMQLPFDILESWQLDYIRSMGNYTVSACLRALSNASKSNVVTDKERRLALQLLKSLEALKDEIDDPIFNDAYLIAEPVQAPCRGPSEESRPGQATLITFRLMAPVGTRAPGKKLDFIPLAFFKVQQLVFKNSPDHEIFARKAYREYSPVLDITGRPNPTHIKMPKKARDSKVSIVDSDLSSISEPASRQTPSPESHKPSFSKKIFNRRRSQPGNRIKGDNSSEKDLVEHGSEDHTLGGIMVSQEVEIHSKVEERPSSSTISAAGEKVVAIEMSKLKNPPKTGIISTATAEVETESYVDELFKICVRSI